jgi:hypothetical protein
MAQRNPIPAANDPHEEIPLDEVTAHFVPKTELGPRLLALCADGVRSGIPMHSDDDLDREIAERRVGSALWENGERHRNR